MNAFPRRFSRPQNKFTLPSHWSDLDSTATPGCRGGWVRCFWHIYALWWEECHTPPGRETGTKAGLVNLSSCPCKNVSSWGLYGHLGRVIICCDGCLIIAGHTVASVTPLNARKDISHSVIRTPQASARCFQILSNDWDCPQSVPRILKMCETSTRFRDNDWHGLRAGPTPRQAQFLVYFTS